ncbi:MAG TPA: hypothetical protein VMV99_15015 [Rhodanobacter sp.]|nr:hypothetical protein [Rhodanobacter sp.]
MLAAQQSLQAALERETVLQTKLDHFVVAQRPSLRSGGDTKYQHQKNDLT